MFATGYPTGDRIQCFFNLFYIFKKKFQFIHRFLNSSKIGAKFLRKASDIVTHAVFDLETSRLNFVKAQFRRKNPPIKSNLFPQSYLQGIKNTRYDGFVRPPSRMKTHA